MEYPGCPHLRKKRGKDPIQRRKRRKVEVLVSQKGENPFHSLFSNFTPEKKKMD